ncbi:MAG TPA: hypothetical protein VF746_23400 [Longimicrobium sp.]|jgi:hypothetical protein
MATETRWFNDTSTDLERVARSLADWLVRDKGFVLKVRARTDDGAVLKLEKSDFGRQLTGLLYSLDITLRREGSRVGVTVDDGDIRNQALALGIGLVVLWPLLLTAGYGWITKGEVRNQVIAFVARELGAAM